VERRVSEQPIMGLGNPGLVHELPLHWGVGSGVWCAMSARREISTVSGHELQTETRCAGILTAVGREGDIFSICSSTGEFVLHFLQVDFTARVSRLFHRLLILPRFGV